jgi:hypothetical protein
MKNFKIEKNKPTKNANKYALMDCEKESMAWSYSYSLRCLSLEAIIRFQREIRHKKIAMPMYKNDVLAIGPKNIPKKK